MNNVSRPRDLLEITREILHPFNDVLLDRDGLTGHYGQPIEPHMAEHVNGLIADNPDKRFTIITNGFGDTEPINAEVVRTPMPFIKQLRPIFIRSLVEDPDQSLLITDSFSETAIVSLAGFHVFYVREKLTPHPFEQRLRRASQPLRAPLKKLVRL